MEYVVGIDAGATKTRIEIADLDGRVLADGAAPAGNINAVSADLFREHLCAAIDTLTGQHALDKARCAGVCIGAAGGGTARNRHLYLQVLEATGLAGSKSTETDALAALYGAMGGRKGIVLIAGTGSICLGAAEDGTLYRAGGWGHLIGDDGGGYGIGRMVLQSIMKDFDRGIATSQLQALVFKTLGIRSHEQLIDYVYDPAREKSEIARLAEICRQAEENGDATARDLLVRAGCELAALLRTVYSRAFGGSGECRWSYSGSVIERCGRVRETVLDHVQADCPRLRMAEPLREPAYGAVLLALEKAGRPGNGL